jgi:sugar (pentulose or hexulose) kinase
MELWFFEELAQIARMYSVKALAVSTHGATFIGVDAEGNPVLPCVYYTHEPGAEFHNRFYKRCGRKEDLQTYTGTPAFDAMINPAKGILFAQETFPAEYKNTTALLPYPQYWGFRLTGKKGCESTYMGCHTYLWDYTRNTLSTVAHELGVAHLIPQPLSKSWDILGTIQPSVAKKTGLPENAIVTMGIHDSNSSLFPHFAKKGNSDFALNSTGTWCVMMKEASNFSFAQDELGEIVFFNISVFGSPVKTAVFLGGYEFETWSNCFKQIHHQTNLPGYDEKRYRKVLHEASSFLLPELVAGSGQFSGSRARIVDGQKTFYFETIMKGDVPACCADYEDAIALLRISLVIQSITALERAGCTENTEIITEGGFRRDEAYNKLLSAAFARNHVLTTDVPEATALGAAMTAYIALTGRAPASLASLINVEYQEAPKTVVPELLSYRLAWLKECTRL